MPPKPLRQQPPSRAEQRTRDQDRAAQDQRDRPVEAHVRVDGKLYVFSVSDASAEDAAALRRATGMSLQGLFRAALEDLDIDVVAALVWLVRRQQEPRLRYEAVAAEISYDTDIDFEDPDASKDGRIRAVDDDQDGGLDPTSPAS